MICSIRRNWLVTAGARYMLQTAIDAPHAGVANFHLPIMARYVQQV